MKTSGIPNSLRRVFRWLDPPAVMAVTAMFAATVGLVQNDIKKVIAYSTCSQLGYMFVGLGVGG